MAGTNDTKYMLYANSFGAENTFFNNKATKTPYSDIRKIIDGLVLEIGNKQIKYISQEFRAKALSILLRMNSVDQKKYQEYYKKLKDLPVATTDDEIKKLNENRDKFFVTNDKYISRGLKKDGKSEILRLQKESPFEQRSEYVEKVLDIYSQPVESRREKNAKEKVQLLEKSLSVGKFNSKESSTIFDELNTIYSEVITAQESQEEELQEKSQEKSQEESQEESLPEESLQEEESQENQEIIRIRENIEQMKGEEYLDKLVSSYKQQQPVYNTNTFEIEQEQKRELYKNIYKLNKAKTELRALLNENDGPNPFVALSDDLMDIYASKGYSPDQAEKVNRYLVDKDIIEISNFIVKGKYNDLPVEPDSISEEGRLPDTIDPRISQMTDALTNEQQVIAQNDAAAQAIVDADAQAEQIDNAVADEKLKIIEETMDVGGTEKKLYIERYHKYALKIFLEDDVYPVFDLKLESNILSSKLTSKEIVEKIDSIIKLYGPILDITERMSDTLQELNECTQLKFCLLRNLKFGPRGQQTASVPLSQIKSLKAAASQLQSSGNVGNNLEQQARISQRVGLPNLVQGTSTEVQTKEDKDFIQFYDDYRKYKNLKDSIPIIRKDNVVLNTSYNLNPTPPAMIPKSSNIVENTIYKKKRF